jgi:hypothetical protein
MEELPRALGIDARDDIKKGWRAKAVEGRGNEVGVGSFRGEDSDLAMARFSREGRRRRRRRR